MAGYSSQYAFGKTSMCQICVEYEKGLLTKDEAQRNAGELLGTAIDGSNDMTDEMFEHLLDVADNIGEDDDGQSKN